MKQAEVRAWSVEGATLCRTGTRDWEAKVLRTVVPVSSFPAHASFGEVGFTSGIGVYGAVSAGGREVGAGAYVNATSNATCMAAKR